MVFLSGVWGLEWDFFEFLGIGLVLRVSCLGFGVLRVFERAWCVVGFLGRVGGECFVR